KSQWAPIKAATPNGFYVTAYVYAEPAYINAPAITSAPKLSAPQNGEVAVAYALDLGAHEDQSLVSWSICDDAACAKAREVAVSRGNVPATALRLLPGFAGKFLKVTVRPKIEISEPGPGVSVISANPIAASAILSA